MTRRNVESYALALEMAQRTQGVTIPELHYAARYSTGETTNPDAGRRIIRELVKDGTIVKTDKTRRFSWTGEESVGIGAAVYIMSNRHREPDQ